MKKILLAFVLCAISIFGYAQCTTGNATDCQCKDSSQTDCDLLPDIQVGRPPFYQYGIDYGIKEFYPSGNFNPSDNSRLYVTVSTPNPGHGPLELYTVDTFVCQNDTFYGTAPSICPDLITYPRIFMNQRIYHKNGNAMTSWSRFAGTMTYHPSHNHMHVDNWGNYTIRQMDSLQPDPLQWAIIGSGTKLAFCVEDYGTCANWPDHCLDSAGNSLNNNTDFPNYGLGGGGYFCSTVIQGITSGYVDVYWTTLEGMYCEIPPGLCDGDYYIVVEVDPNHNFLEEDETNNWYAVPFRLKRQLLNPATDNVNILIQDSKTQICTGDSIVLTAVDHGLPSSYLWSNGDTTQSTTITQPGQYYVTLTNQCGTGPSLTVDITGNNSPGGPVGINDTIPVPGQASLMAASPYPITWYDQPIGGNLIGSGSSVITPFINSSTYFYAEAAETNSGIAIDSVGPVNNTISGTGNYVNSSDRHLTFDCYNEFILHTVDVYANSTINSTDFELYDSSGALLATKTITGIVSGLNTITLDFHVTPGRGYQLSRTTGNLYRNKVEIVPGYPFTVSNVMSITGTVDVGTGEEVGYEYYYYFYNWDIRLPDVSCKSPRTAVLAYVTQPNAIADVFVMKSLKVFPNPANSKINVSYQSSENINRIELIDALGKVNYSKDIYSKAELFQEEIDISSMSRGIYFLHFISEGKNYYHQVVIE